MRIFIPEFYNTFIDFHWDCFNEFMYFLDKNADSYIVTGYPRRYQRYIKRLGVYISLSDIVFARYHVKWYLFKKIFYIAHPNLYFNHYISNFINYEYNLFFHFNDMWYDHSTAKNLIFKLEKISKLNGTIHNRLHQKYIQYFYFRYKDCGFVITNPHDFEHGLYAFFSNQRIVARKAKIFLSYRHLIFVKNWMICSFESFYFISYFDKNFFYLIEQWDIFSIIENYLLSKNYNYLLLYIKYSLFFYSFIYTFDKYANSNVKYYNLLASILTFRFWFWFRRFALLRLKAYIEGISKLVIESKRLPKNYKKLPFFKRAVLPLKYSLKKRLKTTSEIKNFDILMNVFYLIRLGFFSFSKKKPYIIYNYYVSYILLNVVLFYFLYLCLFLFSLINYVKNICKVTFNKLFFYKYTMTLIWHFFYYFRVKDAYIFKDIQLQLMYIAGDISLLKTLYRTYRKIFYDNTVWEETKEHILEDHKLWFNNRSLRWWVEYQELREKETYGNYFWSFEIMMKYYIAYVNYGIQRVDSKFFTWDRYVEINIDAFKTLHFFFATSVYRLNIILFNLNFYLIKNYFYLMDSFWFKYKIYGVFFFYCYITHVLFFFFEIFYFIKKNKLKLIIYMFNKNRSNAIKNYKKKAIIFFTINQKLINNEILIFFYNCFKVISYLLRTLYLYCYFKFYLYIKIFFYYLRSFISKIIKIMLGSVFLTIVFLLLFINFEFVKEFIKLEFGFFTFDIYLMFNDILNPLYKFFCNISDYFIYEQKLIDNEYNKYKIDTDTYRYAFNIYYEKWKEELRMYMRKFYMIWYLEKKEELYYQVFGRHFKISFLDRYEYYYLSYLIYENNVKIKIWNWLIIYYYPILGWHYSYKLASVIAFFFHWWLDTRNLTHLYIRFITLNSPTWIQVYIDSYSYIFHIYFYSWLRFFYYYYMDFFLDMFSEGETAYIFLNYLKFFICIIRIYVIIGFFEIGKFIVLFLFYFFELYPFIYIILQKLYKFFFFMFFFKSFKYYVFIDFLNFIVFTLQFIYITLYWIFIYIFDYVLEIGDQFRNTFFYKQIFFLKNFVWIFIFDYLKFIFKPILHIFFNQFNFFSPKTFLSHGGIELVTTRELPKEFKFWFGEESFYSYWRFFFVNVNNFDINIHNIFTLWNINTIYSTPVAWPIQVISWMLVYYICFWFVLIYFRRILSTWFIDNSYLFQNPYYLWDRFLKDKMAEKLTLVEHLWLTDYRALVYENFYRTVNKDVEPIINWYEFTKGVNLQRVYQRLLERSLILNDYSTKYLKKYWELDTYYTFRFDNIIFLIDCIFKKRYWFPQRRFFFFKKNDLYSNYDPKANKWYLNKNLKPFETIDQDVDHVKTELLPKYDVFWNRHCFIPFLNMVSSDEIISLDYMYAYFCKAYYYYDEYKSEWYDMSYIHQDFLDNMVFRWGGKHRVNKQFGSLVASWEGWEVLFGKNPKRFLDYFHQTYNNIFGDIFSWYNYINSHYCYGYLTLHFPLALGVIETRKTNVNIGVAIDEVDYTARIFRYIDARIEDQNEQSLDMEVNIEIYNLMGDAYGNNFTQVTLNCNPVNVTPLWSFWLWYGPGMIMFFIYGQYLFFHEFYSSLLCVGTVFFMLLVKVFSYKYHYLFISESLWFIPKLFTSKRLYATPVSQWKAWLVYGKMNKKLDLFVEALRNGTRTIGGLVNVLYLLLPFSVDFLYLSTLILIYICFNFRLYNLWTSNDLRSNQ